MYGRRSPTAPTTKKPPSTTSKSAKTRAIGYVRVSTEGQAQDGLSLGAQRARLAAYCVAMDLELLDVVTDEMSARSLNRPGIQKVLKQLERGEADALVVAKLDRLTRSVRDLGMLVENYFSEGNPWSLLSVGDSIDTRTASGRLVLNVLGSVSQWEREAIGERTREALAIVKAQGFKLGHPFYGYRRSDKLDEYGRKTIEPDPEKQRVIALVCDMFDRSISPQLLKLAGAWPAGGCMPPSIGPVHSGLTPSEWERRLPRRWRRQAGSGWIGGWPRRGG